MFGAAIPPRFVMAQMQSLFARIETVPLAGTTALVTNPQLAVEHGSGGVPVVQVIAAP